MILGSEAGGSRLKTSHTLRQIAAPFAGGITGMLTRVKLSAPALVADGPPDGDARESGGPELLPAHKRRTQSRIISYEM
jgi:hypothetical protein